MRIEYAAVIGTAEHHVRRREDIDPADIIIGNHDILEYGIDILVRFINIVGGIIVPAIGKGF